MDEWFTGGPQGEIGLDAEDVAPVVEGVALKSGRVQELAHELVALVFLFRGEEGVSLSVRWDAPCDV